MTSTQQINRRSFVVGTAAAAGGGLALSVGFPFAGPQVVRAQDGSPEINAWVCRHYGHVICLLQDTISRKSHEPLDWLRALLAQVILYLIGVCSCVI